VKTKTWNAVNGMSAMEVVWVSQVITLPFLLMISAVMITAIFTTWHRLLLLNAAAEQEEAVPATATAYTPPPSSSPSHHIPYPRFAQVPFSLNNQPSLTAVS
jgi:hypothetical protein